MSNATKITVEVMVDFKGFDKAATRLARVGGIDGDAFVNFGGEVKALVKKGVPIDTVYLRGIEKGVHDFRDVKALYESCNAHTFHEWSGTALSIDTHGVKRSYYKTLFTLMRKATGKKATISADVVGEAIADARAMGYIAHRQKYLPREEKPADENATSDVSTEALESADLFEGSAHDDCSTLESIVARVRELTARAFKFNGIDGSAAVLNAAMEVHESLSDGADVASDAVTTEALENAQNVAA